MQVGTRRTALAGFRHRPCGLDNGWMLDAGDDHFRLANAIIDTKLLETRVDQTRF
jgi:hypothetical protein